VTISTPLGGLPPASSGVAHPAGGASLGGFCVRRACAVRAAEIGVGAFALPSLLPPVRAFAVARGFAFAVVFDAELLLAVVLDAELLFAVVFFAELFACARAGDLRAGDLLAVAFFAVAFLAVVFFAAGDFFAAAFLGFALLARRLGAVREAAFAASVAAFAPELADSVSVEPPEGALPSAARRPDAGASPRFRDRLTGRDRGRLERTSLRLSSAIG
jgi:hypothetical protein